MRDRSGQFLLNFDGLSLLLLLLLLPTPLPSPPLSGVGGGNIRHVDENVAQRLHSHSFMHFNKSKEGEVEGGGKKRWRGCNLLFKHSVFDSCAVEQSADGALALTEERGSSACQ